MEYLQDRDIYGADFVRKIIPDRTVVVSMSGSVVEKKGPAVIQPFPAQGEIIINPVSPVEK